MCRHKAAARTKSLSDGNNIIFTHSNGLALAKIRISRRYARACTENLNLYKWSKRRGMRGRGELPRAQHRRTLQARKNQRGAGFGCRIGTCSSRWRGVPGDADSLSPIPLRCPPLLARVHGCETPEPLCNSGILKLTTHNRLRWGG